MKFGKYVKGAVTLLTIASLAFAMDGCGSKKGDAGFKVPADKLPKGVISVTRPPVNKETLFVRTLVQESLRRYLGARLYTEALVRYDIENGNAKDHERLLNKTKAAWKRAKDCASVASFYAMGLCHMSRRADWDPYQETALLNTSMLYQMMVPEFNFMPTVYAAETKKKKKKTDFSKLQYNSADEVFKNYSESDLKEMVDKYPEGKQLMGISNALHVDGKTATEIMNRINPDYQKSGQGWKATAYDVAYRSASVLKTTGKGAGVVLAGVGVAAASTPALLVLGGTAFLVKVVDTGLDAAQTAVVLFTGNEDKGLNKVLAKTGKADAVMSLLTLDLTKPVLKMKGIGDYKFIEGTKIIDKLKGYGYINARGTGDMLKLLAEGKLKEAGKLVGLEGFNNAFGTAYGLITGFKGGDAVVVSEGKTKDGGTETRTGVISTKEDKAEDKEKAAALGVSQETIKKQEDSAKQENAAAVTATSEQTEKQAEDVSKSGGSDKTKDDVDKFVDNTRKEIIKDTGMNPGDLDKEIEKAAEKEMKETKTLPALGEEGESSGEVSGEVSGKESGEISGKESGEISGEASGIVSGKESGKESGEVSGAVSGNESGKESGESIKGETAGEESGKEDKDKQNDSGEATKDKESGRADTDKKHDSGQVSGNVDTGKDSGSVSEPGNDEDAPYAIHKVIGASYSVSYAVAGRTVSARYRVISTGGWIAIACSNSEAGSFTANVTSYDPQTGVGVGVANGESLTFRIVGEPGSMSLRFNQ